MAAAALPEAWPASTSSAERARMRSDTLLCAAAWLSGYATQAMGTRVPA